MGDYHILQQFDIDADRSTVRATLSSAESIASWWSNHTELTDGADPQLQVGFPDVPQPFEFSIRDGGADRIEWVTGGFPPWWAGTTIPGTSWTATTASPAPGSSSATATTSPTTP